MAVPGLHCCMWAFSNCGEQRCKGSCCSGFSCYRAASSCTTSVIVVHGLICPVACETLLNQGVNPCPLHWQAGSWPLDKQASPEDSYFNKFLRKFSAISFLKITSLPFYLFSPSKHLFSGCWTFTFSTLLFLTLLSYLPAFDLYSNFFSSFF